MKKSIAKVLKKAKRIDAEKTSDLKKDEKLLKKGESRLSALLKKLRATVSSRPKKRV